ncbi:hypothetical protein MPLDJ20_120232 [Mesorhizobium plurifarium]|uniref:Uncharacterized protein n=1 Tax=Mesorhizobium plurifarium TaxID=69974 RepID=A0A090EH20_MESPL|nr:hypothetical protein MPLDJ20_120232 [Mesorhizobium plurifarium]
MNALAAGTLDPAASRLLPVVRPVLAVHAFIPKNVIFAIHSKSVSPIAAFQIGRFPLTDCKSTAM